MSVAAWRIAVEAPAYAANDLSDTGAKLTGGRWNSKGMPVVYCATNITLATLETVLYLRNGGLPFNRYLVRIEVPDTVWDARQVLDPLPGGWDAIPAGLTARTAGDVWIASAASALLLAPSAIVPDEYNVVINPQHSDASDCRNHPQALNLRSPPVPLMRIGPTLSRANCLESRESFVVAAEHTSQVSQAQTVIPSALGPRRSQLSDASICVLPLGHPASIRRRPCAQEKNGL